jgi:hypothetical protein
MASIHRVIKIGIKKIAIKKYIAGANSFPVIMIDKKATAVGHQGWYIPAIAIPTYKNSFSFVLKYLNVINRPKTIFITTAIKVKTPLRNSSGSKTIKRYTN